MSDLQRIGDGLDDLLRRLGLPAADALQRLVEDWPALAGEPWASRSRPAGLHHGELVVEVADGTSASLLRYEIDRLIEHLAEALGARLVDSVRLRLQTRQNSP